MLVSFPVYIEESLIQIALKVFWTTTEKAWLMNINYVTGRSEAVGSAWLDVNHRRQGYLINI